MVPQISNILCVGLGGAIGAILRYCVSLILGGTHSLLSIPTITVNISGSFLIGFLYATFGAFNLSESIRLLFIVGVLGGYTTFSTFAFDSSSLILKGEWLMLAIYLILNNIGAILAAIAGLYLAKFIFQ